MRGLMNYNLGDLLYMPKFINNPPDWGSAMMNNIENRYPSILKHFPNSIMSEYIRSAHEPHTLENTPNFSLLIKIMSKYDNVKSNPHALVIHFRLGDKGRLSSDFRRVILEVVSTEKPHEIIFLCGLHNNKAFRENGNILRSNNKEDLDELKRKLLEIDSTIKISVPHATVYEKDTADDDTADGDLVTMYNAHKLLLHKGGFSAIGGFICRGNVFLSKDCEHSNAIQEFRKRNHVGTTKFVDVDQ